MKQPIWLYQSYHPTSHRNDSKFKERNKEKYDNILQILRHIKLSLCGYPMEIPMICCIVDLIASNSIPFSSLCCVFSVLCLIQQKIFSDRKIILDENIPKNKILSTVLLHFGKCNGKLVVIDDQGWKRLDATKSGRDQWWCWSATGGGWRPGTLVWVVIRWLTMRGGASIDELWVKWKMVNRILKRKPISTASVII